MRDPTGDLLDEGLGRGPMKVGPHGEGELGVLLRLLGSMGGAALAVGFLALVVSNAGGHLALVPLVGVYVVGVVASVFLPEVWAMLSARSHGTR